MEIQIEFLGLKELPFQNLSIPFSIKEGLVSLKEVELVGPVFSGKMTGDIRLRNPLTQTALHLNAKLSPGSAREPGSGIGDKNRTAPASGAANGPMVFRVEGTLQNPRIVWSQ